MPDLATKTITAENVKKEVANNIYFGPIYPNQVIGGLTVPRFRTSINVCNVTPNINLDLN